MQILYRIISYLICISEVYEITFVAFKNIFLHPRGQITSISFPLELDHFIIKNLLKQILPMCKLLPGE